jgi:EAL domain-containing protein (putative c-di-GMP-specific phosphodiesterase class I)/GGDEF domain-containing protein
MKQRTIDILEKWLYPKFFETTAIVLFVIILLASSYLAVLYTGGTSFAYLHLFYIPIITAGFFFSIRGGLFVGLLASLMIGPFMPLVVEQHILQPTYSVLTRAVFFMLIGTMSGLGSAVFRSYLKELKERYLKNSVTMLPNYLGLGNIFSEKIKTSQDLALIIIDLRNINEIEIAIGPERVDILLKMIAQDLKDGLTGDITIGHTQPSVFTLLVEDSARIDPVIENIHNYLKSSYLIDNIPIFVEAFFGISTYPEDDQNFSGIFRKARMAINYGAKQARSIARYDYTVVDPSGENAVLLTALNEAIADDTLQIHYQPKIVLKTGKIYGLEALARWTHPEKGEIEPSRFIPLTERTMLINPFTKWMLERTFKEMASWEATGKILNLAVNFSLRNFHDRTIITKISELIDKYHFDPTRIEIEVTESAFSTNMDEVIETLTYLREKGIKISIDDFGTGQASQQYLFQLPVDGLKIDRIFVSELGQNPAAEAIVKSAVSLAHQLNLKVIAEGVETQQQLDMLLEMGCDYGQGYLFSPALPYDKLMKWLENPDFKYALNEA